MGSQRIRAAEQCMQKLNTTIVETRRVYAFLGRIHCRCRYTVRL